MARQTGFEPSAKSHVNCRPLGGPDKHDDCRSDGSEHERDIDRQEQRKPTQRTNGSQGRLISRHNWTRPEGSKIAEKIVDLFLLSNSASAQLSISNRKLS